MKNLTFYNEEKKRLAFSPKCINEINEYLDKNHDATLIIDFSDLLLDHKKFNDFKTLDGINLRKLMFTANPRSSFYNLDTFKKIPNLIELDDRTPIEEINYNFLNYPRLEILRLTWSKRFQNINECSNLTELSLWSYKSKTGCLNEFNSLTRLKELRIIQSNITSIKGINNFDKIVEMSFVANRKLSFDDLESQFPNAEVLYIENCNNISIQTIVKLFPNVKELTFLNNHEVESIKFILDKLKNLEKLNIYNLKILESDNKYWKDYKNLKGFNFQDRKHHLLKRKDFENV
jgi:Leucine-rich repeat (LRR) protein